MNKVFWDNDNYWGSHFSPWLDSSRQHGGVRERRKREEKRKALRWGPVAFSQKKQSFKGITSRGRNAWSRSLVVDMRKGKGRKGRSAEMPSVDGEGVRTGRRGPALLAEDRKRIREGRRNWIRGKSGAGAPRRLRARSGR